MFDIAAFRAIGFFCISIRRHSANSRLATAAIARRYQLYAGPGFQTRRNAARETVRWLHQYRRSPADICEVRHAGGHVSQTLAAVPQGERDGCAGDSPLQRVQRQPVGVRTAAAHDVVGALLNGERLVDAQRKCWRHGGAFVVRVQCADGQLDVAMAAAQVDAGAGDLVVGRM